MLDFQLVDRVELPHTKCELPATRLEQVDSEPRVILIHGLPGDERHGSKSWKASEIQLPCLEISCHDGRFLKLICWLLEALLRLIFLLLELFSEINSFAP